MSTSQSIINSPIHMLPYTFFMFLLQNIRRDLCELELLTSCKGSAGLCSKTWTTNKSHPFSVRFLEQSQNEFVKPCCWLDIYQNIEFLSLIYLELLFHFPAFLICLQTCECLFWELQIFTAHETLVEESHFASSTFLHIGQNFALATLIE